MFDNNCEHFVMWCKCGLNVSLQVKPWHRNVWEGVKAGASAGFEGIKRAAPTILKTVANLSDEAFSAVSSVFTPVGFVAGYLIETGLAVCSIYKDRQKVKKGFLSENEYKVNTFKTSAKLAGRYSGGVAGSVIGSAFGPIGSVFGGAIGAGVGHLTGAAVGWCYENGPKIKKAFDDYVVAPIKKAVDICTKEVKTAARKVCEGVKSVFNFLFSW